MALKRSSIRKLQAYHEKLVGMIREGKKVTDLMFSAPSSENMAEVNVYLMELWETSKTAEPDLDWPDMNLSLSLNDDSAVTPNQIMEELQLSILREHLLECHEPEKHFLDFKEAYIEGLEKCVTRCGKQKLTPYEYAFRKCPYFTMGQLPNNRQILTHATVWPDDRQDLSAMTVAAILKVWNILLLYPELHKLFDGWDEYQHVQALPSGRAKRATQWGGFYMISRREDGAGMMGEDRIPTVLINKFEPDEKSDRFQCYVQHFIAEVRKPEEERNEEVTYLIKDFKGQIIFWCKGFLIYAYDMDMTTGRLEKIV